MSKTDFGAWISPLTGVGVAFPPPTPLDIRPLECGAYRATQGWSYRDVISPFWRCYHNGKPGGSVLLGTTQIPLTPSTITLIPPVTRFDCSAPDGIPHLWIHFAAEPIPLRLQEPLRIEVTPDLRALLTQCRQLTRQAEDTLLLQTTSECLLRLLWARHPALRTPPTPDIQHVLTFIHGHLSSDCSNRVLARQVNRSVEGFIRWFRAETGSAPHDYVLGCRVREAARLLTYTEHSIEEIADAAGFPNRHYLSRVFATRLGVPPARFRRESRSRPETSRPL